MSEICHLMREILLKTRGKKRLMERNVTGVITQTKKLF